jgi:hypothetical protein
LEGRGPEGACPQAKTPGSAIRSSKLINLPTIRAISITLQP